MTPVFNPGFINGLNSWIEGNGYFFAKDKDGFNWWCVISEQGVYSIPFYGYKFTINQGIFEQKYYSTSPHNYVKVTDPDNLLYRWVTEGSMSGYSDAMQSLESESE